MPKLTRKILAICGLGILIGSLSIYRSRPRVEPPGQTALRHIMPAVRFTDQPLESVFQELSRMCRVPIDVDWSSLEKGGIERTSPVSLHRYDVTLPQAIADLNAQVGNATLTCVDRQDRILIETLDAAFSDRVLSVFDVADLLNGSLLDQIGDPSDSDWPPSDDERTRQCDKLMSLVEESIGRVYSSKLLPQGRIQIISNTLVVEHSILDQRSVAACLADLRQGGPKADWPGPWREEEVIRVELDRRVMVDVDFSDELAARALDRVREVFRANVEVSPDKSKFQELDFDQPVTAHLHHPTLAEALTAACQPALYPGSRVGFFPEDGKVKVSTDTAAADHLVRQIYDVRPLFPPTASFADCDAFIESLEKSGAEIWRGVGDDPGQVTHRYPGRFVINQTRANHQKIRQWLDARLAKARGAAGLGSDTP